MAATSQTNEKSELLREAVTLARSGDRALARKLLDLHLTHHPRSEQAWLWRATVSESREEAVGCLERLLEINPHNEHARQALGRFATAPGGEPPPSTAAPGTRAMPIPISRPAWSCPFCSTTFPDSQVVCPKCRSFCRLTTVQELTSYHGAEELVLEQSVTKWQSRAEQNPSFDAHYWAALALLHLGRVSDALPHLQAAHAFRQSDIELLRALRAIESRRVVMVVDDSPTIRQAVSEALEQEECRVIAVPDGVHALTRLETERPSLILLDITMPRMDGYQTCKVIRQNAALKNIPVIMLSGNDGFFDKVKGRLAGAAEYLTKPLSTAVLRKTLQRFPPKTGQ